MILLSTSDEMLPFKIFLLVICFLLFVRFVLWIISMTGIFKYKKKKFTPAEIETIKSYLQEHLYYQNLSLKGKVRFFDRMIRFMINKEFLGMENLQVTDEMRARISACGIQLTFGLDEYMLPFFHSIRIFPKEFYSRFVESYLKGGTTQSGIVMVSWNNFTEGFAEPHDKYNLGLHEMAHALLLDLLYGNEPNEHLKNHIGEWEFAGDIEMEKLKNRQPHFLRAYGGTNEHEFFAVSVEHFFEVPEEFKKNLPEVYKRLAILLNQDPLNISGDYQR